MRPIKTFNKSWKKQSEIPVSVNYLKKMKGRNAKAQSLLSSHRKLKSDFSFGAFSGQNIMMSVVVYSNGLLILIPSFVIVFVFCLHYSHQGHSSPLCIDKRCVQSSYYCPGEQTTILGTNVLHYIVDSALKFFLTLSSL